MTDHRDFYLEAPVYDEAVCTADPWPLPDTHPELMPQRDDSMLARMARLWDSWVRAWL